MSIPKKGSRKIVVSDTEYRWTVRAKPTYEQGAFGANATAAVELYENPGCVLSIEFPWVRCDNWLGQVQTPITPKHIEACIVVAIEEGWSPSEQGGAYKYVHNE